MTATVKEAPAAATKPAYRVTGQHVLRSELTKLWSLRSTWITLGLGLLFLVAFGIIAALRYHSGITSGRQMDPDFADATGLSLSLFGVPLSQLALGVLGVLVSAGEYSTGSIRSTLASVPRRLPVLWSKATVYGVVALLIALVGTFVTFFVDSGIVQNTPAAMTISSSGVARSLLGATVYLALIGVIGVALGALLRSVAGAISALVGALMLVPGLVSLLPTSWRNSIEPYLPSNAGESMFSLHHAPSALSAGPGFLVFAAWTVLALAGAAWRLSRSDA
jgi:ABC-type transport system involved in multi-copper enzyme maturation permease subunit